METQNSTEISSFADQISTTYPFSSIFDLAGDASGLGKTSLGFMELLGFQDLGPSLFDFPELLPTPPATHRVIPESSEVTNFPATPNSSSISSSSTEAANDEHPKVEEEEEEDDDDDEEEEQHQEKMKKASKPKKKNQKRVREPRFAFMTKSEVDHLEDGYRWRKYGQKAVKNSPFPRSYYRCTSALCGVKKRVERSCEDPAVVVTTYEGQHTHPSPAGPRGSTTGISQDSLTFASALSLPVQMTQSHQPYFRNLPPASLSFCSASPEFRSSTAASLLRDCGLLQDIVPSEVRREE